MRRTVRKYEQKRIHIHTQTAMNVLYSTLDFRLCRETW